MRNFYFGAVLGVGFGIVFMLRQLFAHPSITFLQAVGGFLVSALSCALLGGVTTYLVIAFARWQDSPPKRRRREP